MLFVWKDQKNKKRPGLAFSLLKKCPTAFNDANDLLCEVDVVGVVLLDAADHGQVTLLSKLRLQTHVMVSFAWEEVVGTL